MKHTLTDELTDLGMIDIERLHRVHDGDNKRRAGQSTYIYDSMLRLTQTDAKDNIVHVSNNLSTADYHFKAFMNFLNQENEHFEIDVRRNILLNSIVITFISAINSKEYLIGRNVVIFEDIHNEG